MESLPKDPILEFHPDTLTAVRKIYNLDNAKEMDEAIDIFDAWVKQQNHFVKRDFSKSYLERMIINSKGSIERAKSRLDKLCTMRTLMPQFFGNFNVKKDFDDVVKVHMYYAPMPRLTDKHERVFFIRQSSQNCSTSVLLEGFKLCALMCEYMKAHDYAASYMFVVDVRKCNIPDFMMKVGLMDFRNLMTIITEGYGFRLTGIHLITNMKLLDALMALLRQVMSEKIGGRIKVHRTLESVFEVAPKEVLPNEYGEGGEDRSLEEIHGKWMEVLSSGDFRDYLKDTELIIVLTYRTEALRLPPIGVPQVNAPYPVGPCANLWPSVWPAVTRYATS